mgnify:CR=1 FL=1
MTPRSSAPCSGTSETPPAGASAVLGLGALRPVAREEIDRMAPTVVPSIGTLKSLVGQKLGVSEWVTVTQQQIDSFAEATGDHQWIHVDVERARRESPFN